MITRWPWMLAVTLSILLALATSASAEPVWVAWLELLVTTDLPSGRQLHSTEWAILGTYETKRSCAEIRERVLDNPTDGRMRIGETIVFTEGRNTSVSRYYCLPDTVDPRGPKGK